MDDARVLWCDNHLLIWRKAAGEPSVQDKSGDLSALEAARNFVRVQYGKPGDVFLGLVHRLDRPVSGLLMFGRTSKGSARLSAALRERSLHKTYHAVVPGQLSGAGELRQFLWKDEAKNTVQEVGEARPGAKEALTSWKVLAAREGHSLLELEPRTGRPHQLRLACRALGVPILGDLRYGARQSLPDRSIALHNAALSLPHPTRAGRVQATAAWPERPWWAVFLEFAPESGARFEEDQP